ncbi:carbon-nitrogen hydrolase family protein [Ferrovum sp. PN-J185]|uniref:carbon-nitrogen hydrolase family protein n=1 Tax=Ferrovum sp. PN-J185 TaxID=1356306 RepID=UPI000796FC16|nr:carbon-nitrogen hydrolase family protein [Ferrovum sp. PN-J185]KXW55708.1 2-oxoglutaramate amidase [Ferrovum sp. PN-J185]
MTKSTTKKKDSGFGKAKLLPGNFRVAAIQMASGPHVDANLLEAGRLIKMATDQGAAIIGLPEYFAIMGMKDTDKVKVAESFGSGPIQDFLSRSAKRYGVWIVGGSIPIKTEQQNKIRNSSLVFDHTGKCVARYDKIHLFGFQRGVEKYDESKTIEPGNQIVTLNSPFGKIGLSICYDLRFPELYRAMGECDLIFIPSAFTETTGKAHWDTLIRARAIENLAYVIAPAQGGYHMNGRETHGSSMIVDPWGVVLDRLSRGSGIVIAGVNPVHLTELRTSLPALTHKTLKVQSS